MVCVKCGRSVESPDRPCSCARSHYAIQAERGDFVVTGHPVGTVVEGAPDNAQGRAVDSAPGSGGRSYSIVDRAGTFIAELSEPLYRGSRESRAYPARLSGRSHKCCT